MGIFEKMQQLTSGSPKPELEKPKAKHNDIIQGTITSIRKEGYGFIASPDLPFERIFFHWSGLKQKTLRFPELKKRMKVEFTLKFDENDGFKAIKISIL